MEKCKAAFSNSVKCTFADTGICLIMENENINRGLIEGLEKAFGKESGESLQRIINGMGQSFGSCAKRQQIIDTARRVLQSKKS